MKIDFTKFPVWGSINRTFAVEQDVSKQLADVIYMQIPGMEAHNLAHKIYDANGEAEYSENEIEVLKRSMNLFTPIFIDSLNDFFNKQNKEVEL